MSLNRFFATTYNRTVIIPQRFTKWAKCSNTSFKIPAIPGALSISAYVRTTINGYGFVIDLRENGGQEYWWSNGMSDTRYATVDGNTPPFQSGTSMNAFVSPKFVKTYMDFPSIVTGFQWFGRYTDTEPFAGNAQFASLVVRNRYLTEAERLNTTNAFPSDGVLAMYDGTTANGQLLDISGNGHHANIGVGTAPIVQTLPIAGDVVAPNDDRWYEFSGYWGTTQFSSTPDNRYAEPGNDSRADLEFTGKRVHCDWSDFGPSVAHVFIDDVEVDNIANTANQVTEYTLSHAGQHTLSIRSYTNEGYVQRPRITLYNN